MKILFAGDFSVQERAVTLFENIQDAEKAFEQIKDVCSEHELSVVNFESPVTDKGTTILKDGPCILNPRNSVDVLKNVGFNIFTLANNHLRDFGAKGVLDTMDACKKNEINYVGAGKTLSEARNPHIIESSDKKIGIISVCENESSIAKDNQPGANPISEIYLFYDIKELRKKVDYIVVITHGGREHYQLPTPRMKKLYHYIIDLGADIVVNHHQHCYSGYETYKGKLIFYGLGNFYFDRAGKHHSIWNKGFLLSVDLGEKLSYKLIPIIQCDDAPNVLVQSYDTVSEEIRKLNEIIQDDDKLETAYKQMLCKTKPLSSMQPYTGHYVRALYNRGFLPDAISKSKKVAILNIIRCETHRELIIKYLEQELGDNI